MSSVLSQFLPWHSSKCRLPRAHQASYNMAHLKRQYPVDSLNPKFGGNSRINVGPLPSGTTQVRAWDGMFSTYRSPRTDTPRSPPSRTLSQTWPPPAEAAKGLN